MISRNVDLLLGLAIFFSAALLCTERANANFEYSPIVADLSTTGKGSFLLTKVTSHDEADIPVIVRIFERTMTSTGEEVRTPTSDLTAFPTQFILPARGQKFLKIAWKGAADLPFEKSYRILVEHAPVDLNAKKKGAASIRMMTNYSGMIYVNSQSAVANVTIKSLLKKPKQRSLSLEITNDGDRHLILSEPVLEIACKGSTKGPVLLKGPALKNLEGVNMLARATLQTTVSAPANLPDCAEFTWQLRYSLK